MWIDKAAEHAYGLYSLFNEYLSREAFHRLEIVGKQKIGDEEVYVVKATQHIKNVEKTFYFGDFSVGVDLMENQGYVRKARDVVNDAGWYLTMLTCLSKEDKDIYCNQAREYQLKKNANDLATIKQIFEKKIAKRQTNTEENTLELKK